MKNRNLFRTLRKEYWPETLVLVIGFIAINLIFLAGAFRATSTIDPAGAGQLGEFVGGYVGNFFALIGVVLLVATLRSQRQASQLQNFETKYFELIKMHRDNVAELEVQGVTGRKLFVVLIREFRSVLEIVTRISQAAGQKLSKQQVLNVAYYCLFFGTGPNSSRMLRQSLTSFDVDLIDKIESELNKIETKKSARHEKNLCYVPFEGHQSRLGHYKNNNGVRFTS